MFSIRELFSIVMSHRDVFAQDTVVSLLIKALIASVISTKDIKLVVVTLQATRNIWRNESSWYNYHGSNYDNCPHL